MFYINSLALIFSKRHLNLKMIILAPFLSIVFWRVVQILQQCGYSNANILTTIKDSCLEFSAFVQHSRMYRMYVKSKKHIFVINAGFLMPRHFYLKSEWVCYQFVKTV